MDDISHKLQAHQAIEKTCRIAREGVYWVNKDIEKMW